MGMTNGEMIQKDFNCEVCEPILEDDIIHVIFPDKNDSAIGFDLSWWNMEYKEPTTRNCFGCKYSKDNHIAGTEECHLCMWENQYTPTTKNDLAVDAIPREKAIKFANFFTKYHEVKTANELIMEMLRELPSVTPQEPRCKECKWWKDSDGEYRRGCGAESQCPINRKEVFEGNGYCFLFEPQESEDKE